MDTIRIFSKKTFAIGPGAQRGTSEVEYFITVPLSFQDMPAKYKQDPTFLAAVRAKEIEIVEGGRTIIEATPITVKEAENEAAGDPEMDYKEKLKAMDKEAVRAEAERLGAEFIEDDKLSQNKKRVLEAYKLSK